MVVRERTFGTVHGSWNGFRERLPNHRPRVGVVGCWTLCNGREGIGILTMGMVWDMRSLIL